MPLNRGGFSWKRATGISGAKARLSRKTGIPFTKSGRQRKLGRMVSGGGCALALVLLFMLAVASMAYGSAATLAAPSTVTPTLTPTVILTPNAAARTAGNLRAGPGTSYTVAGSVKAGAPLLITGRNAAGTWLQLASGAWIIASMVNRVPTVPVATVSPTPIGSRSLAVVTAAPTAARVCCKHCANSQPCGDSCISLKYTCQKGIGCACP